MSRVSLETSTTVLEFDRDTGSLVRLYSKPSDWEIIKRSRLGLSWRLMLPLEGRRNNNAWGHLQPQKPVCTAQKEKITFVWDGVESEYGGTHNIKITAVCEILNDQAVFKMHIDNRSPEMVENVYYPYIGDLHRPEGCKRFSFFNTGYCALRERELYPTFLNDPGTHSVDIPTMCGPKVQDSPYGMLADDQGNGLYIGVCERRIAAANWFADTYPGYTDAMDSRVIETDTFQGRDVYTRFAVGHLPFIAPGESFDLLPFGMEAYQGCWEKGMDCYLKSSANWNTRPANMPAWAKEPHAWLQIHLNSPEDELRIRFTDLPKIGADCVKHGIKAIQLVGWNEGGQDRGNPSHSPDPRLGTFDELKNAIAQIQAMGVKMILFSKFTWADESHPHFRDVYQPLAVKDPYGNYYNSVGYVYQTLTQLSNVNTRRLIPMCFGSETYRELARREFQKILDLGADGMLYDESQHHSPAMCCFDTRHGHRYGESCYQWDETLINEFREMAKDREFLFAGEANYDFQLNVYDLSYFRSWERNHKAAARYARSDSQMMTAIIGFDDRNMINQCLKDHYIISYEPFHFKGVPSDFPSTTAYGRKMDQLRTQLRKWFWDGKYNARKGAKVTTDGDFENYSVFTAADGTQGVVINNYDDRARVFAVCLESGAPLTRCRLVDWEQEKPFNGTMQIPPRSAAVLF